MFINVILTRSFYLYFVSDHDGSPLTSPDLPQARESGPGAQSRPGLSWLLTSDSISRGERKIGPIFYKAPPFYPLWTTTHTWLDRASSKKSFLHAVPDSKCCDRHQVFKERTGLPGNRIYPRCRTWSRSAQNATSPSRTSSLWGSGTASFTNTASGAFSRFLGKWLLESLMKVFFKMNVYYTVRASF